MAKASFYDQHRRLMVVSPSFRKETIDDLGRDAIIKHYKKRGAILLRGFDLDLNQFARMTDGFCQTSVFNNSAGRNTLDSSRNIQTVNLGQDAFSLHPELSREPWRPDVCFFACLSAPSKGGETLVCDGTGVVAGMSAELRSQFEGRKLTYTQEATPEEIRYWYQCEQYDDATFSQQPESSPFTFTQRNGAVLRSFTVPALYQPMFSERLAFGNMLFFARYMRGVPDFPTYESGDIVDDAVLAETHSLAMEQAVAVRWQERDLLLLDNSRFMHGRNTILDPAERLIISHFGFLDFAERYSLSHSVEPWRAQSWGALLPTTMEGIAGKSSAL